MKFVAVAACTSGIAHTYIAREKILTTKICNSEAFGPNCRCSGVQIGRAHV